MTILLVDDERDTRTVARLALQQFGGFTVIEAESGPEALEVTARARLDAVVLDVMMPGMDGPEVLKALRADPATTDLPVIFLTAKAMPDEIARLRSLGAAAIQTKPFEPEALAADVHATLSRRARPVGAPASGVAATPEDAPPGFVDGTALSRLRGLRTETGDDLLAELIEVFAAHTPLVIDRLRVLAESPGGADAGGVEHLAHALKSSAATLGATGFAAIARTIEHRARDGQIAGIGPLIDELSCHLAPLIERLHAERSHLT